MGWPFLGTSGPEACWPTPCDQQVSWDFPSTLRTGRILGTGPWELPGCSSIKFQGAGKTRMREQPFQGLKGTSLGPQHCGSPPPFYVSEECIKLQIPNTATQSCHLVLFRTWGHGPSRVS